MSESRTTLLTSRVRRQRYTTSPRKPYVRTLLRRHLQSSSSSSARGPSSSSRAIIIIRIWIARLPRGNSSTRAPRRYLDTYTICCGVGNRRQLVSGIAFSPRKLRRRVAMKMMFMGGRYVIFSFPFHAGAHDDVKLCRRVRGNSLNDLMLSSIYVCSVISSEVSRPTVIITSRFLLFALFSLIAIDFPSNLPRDENTIL